MHLLPMTGDGIDFLIIQCFRKPLLLYPVKLELGPGYKDNTLCAAALNTALMFTRSLLSPF